jgi:hypothetical protein
MYILKLLFDNIGNYYDFSQLNLSTKYQINFFVDDQDMKEIKEKNGIKISNFGFDYLFFPIKREKDSFLINEKNDKDFTNLLKFLLNLRKSDNNEEQTDIIPIINNNNNDDLDFFYCAILNIHLSNYYKDNYFFNNDDNSEKTKVNKWIQERIDNNEIEILKKNEILLKILSLFINKENFNKISPIRLPHNELLCILISARFVLNTISNNNKERLFYQLVIEPKNAIDKYKNFFAYYLKGIEEFNKEKREISFLTYKMINYIILSHLYFAYLLNILNNIDNKNDICHSLSLNSNKELKDLLVEEFAFIKDNILNLIGIKK